jgi:hypothetical protein
LREKFYPAAKQSHALNYAVLRDGKTELKRTLAVAEEGGSELRPGPGRFHITPENRLFVVYYIEGTNGSGQPVKENRLVEIMADGIPGTEVVIPLKQPFSSFFTATVRAGSRPSEILDLLGIQAGVKNAVSYAKIRLF